MTPAEEITTAAAKMRTLTGPAAEPIAKMLAECVDLHEQSRAHDCQWCNDEDWPCADVRNALAVARAINGGQP